MVQSLLYVSVRRANPDPNAHDVDDIVGWSRGRNAELGLTGALAATQHHYAQILEGDATTVGAMMASIRRDPRHENLRIASVEQRAQRDFPRWSLAYHGESSYVSEMLVAAIDDPDFELVRHAQNIRSLLAMFV